MRIYRPKKLIIKNRIVKQKGSGLRIIPLTIEKKTKVLPTLGRLRAINFSH